MGVTGETSNPSPTTKRPLSHLKAQNLRKIPKSLNSEAMPTFAEVAQLKEALASCVQQTERMQKELVARNQPAQPDTTLYQPSQYGVPPAYGQPAPGSMSSNPPQPRMPNGQSTNGYGYQNLGPRRPSFTPRPPTTCFTCGRTGHVSHYCPNNRAASTSMQAQQPPAPDIGSGKVQQAMKLKELRDVYVPVQLFNRKTSDCWIQAATRQ